MRSALVVTLVVLGGCNQLFDLREVVPSAIDAAPGSTPCGPLKFDPARYRSYPQGTTPLSWQGARDVCRFGGYDLIALDEGDPDELANESNGGALPFWLGTSYGTDWQGVDGCMPHLDWAPTEPAEMAIGDCVVQTGLKMRSELCTRNTIATMPISALCEVPRPTVHCMTVASERTYMMVPGTMNHTDAASACGALGMHLVEINSSDELNFVVSHFPSAPTFWLGATKGGGTFTSPTGCPQAWTWGPNDPDGTNSCVIYAQGPMESFDCNTTSPAVICESNSL